ncbi:hypothetical protein Bca52824_035214 [Brassica carinata]|uniref:Uncharacterized protein n=1 Tax=Brassica carinata TaxID=52824 RepID=A0A8X7V1I8_BRACI|nr:hypothetical protein Bca52824_035214 [Brassica carinata]
MEEYSRSFLIQDCYPNVSNPSTPGAKRPATSSASRYPLPILAAVMSSPERCRTLLLHPQRLNGDLWSKYKVVSSGLAPALTEVVRKTHTRKDVTCIDKRAEVYVKTAESLALEQSQSSTVTGETELTPSNQQLTAACIETATNTKGKVYGLGLFQYVDAEPK